MKKISILKWLFMLLLVFGSISALFYVFRQEKLYSDPLAFRGETGLKSSWHWYFGTPSGKPVAGRVNKREISIKDDEGQFSIIFDRAAISRRNNNWVPEAPSVIKADPETLVARLPEGFEIKLEAIATHYPVAKNKVLSQVYRLPELKRLPLEKERELHSHVPSYSSNAPLVSFKVTGDKVGLVTNNHQIFNTQTQADIKGFYSFSHVTKDGKVFFSTINQWHPTPILATFQVGSEKTVRSKLKPNLNSVAKFDDFDLGLFLLAESKGIGNDCKANGYKGFTLKKDTSESVGTVLGFEYFNISKKIRRCVINYHLENGEVVSRTNKRAQRLLFAHSIPYPKDQIKEIEVVVSDPDQYLCFEVDTIPGLPEANKDLDNLFDAKIPYFQDQRGFANTYPLNDVFRLAQSPSAYFRPAVSPRQSEYKNRTVHQIMRSKMRQNGVFRFTQSSGRIEEQKFSKEWVKQRLKF